MNMNDKIKAFLKEVNRHSKFVKVVRDTDFTPSCIGFKVILRPDPFLNKNSCINVSDLFEKTVNNASYKYFGKTLTFNNTHTIFWVFV